MAKRQLSPFLVTAYILTSSHINANSPVNDGYACLNTFALSAELELEVDQQTDFLTIKNRKCVKVEDCSSFCYRTNLTCTTDDNHRSPTGHVYQKTYVIYRLQDGLILESECCKTQTVRALNCSTRHLDDDGKMPVFENSGSYFVRSMNWTAVEVCKAVPVSPSLSMVCNKRRVPEYNDEILRDFASEPGTQADGISSGDSHVATSSIHSQLPEPYSSFGESPLMGAEGAESSAIAENAVSSSSATSNSAVSGSAVGAAAAGTAAGVAGGGAAGLSQLGLIGLVGLLGLEALAALDSTTTTSSSTSSSTTTSSTTTSTTTAASCLRKVCKTNADCCIDPRTKPATTLTCISFFGTLTCGCYMPSFGIACTAGSQCCSGTCTTGTCDASAAGQFCRKSNDCVSGNCGGLTCN